MVSRLLARTSPTMELLNKHLWWVDKALLQTSVMLEVKSRTKDVLIPYWLRLSGGTPIKLILGCPARSLETLPFHILNFGKSRPFQILNFKNCHPLHNFPWKVTPFTYLQPETPFLYLEPKKAPSIIGSAPFPGIRFLLLLLLLLLLGQYFFNMCFCGKGEVAAHYPFFA